MNKILYFVLPMILLLGIYGSQTSYEKGGYFVPYYVKQSNTIMTMSLENSTYEQGETINVYGKINHSSEGVSVLMKIIDPAKNVVGDFHAATDRFGIFTQFFVIPDTFPSGKYVLTAYYEGDPKKTLLSFEINISNTPTGETRIFIPFGASVEGNNLNFAPPIVVVPKGTKIVWTNNDITVHTVISGKVNDDGSFSRDGRFQGGYITPSANLAISPNPGDYTYFCQIHPWLGGTISVKPSPVTAKPAPPVTAKPAPPVTAKPVPPVTAKPVPPVTAKPVPPVTAKPVPPVTAKPAPKVTAKPVPSTNSKPPTPLDNFISTIWKDFVSFFTGGVSSVFQGNNTTKSSPSGTAEPSPDIDEKTEIPAGNTIIKKTPLNNLQLLQNSLENGHFALEPSPNPVIQAFVSKTSVYPGETLDFYVNSTKNYKVSVYRLGAYSDPKQPSFKLVYDSHDYIKGIKQPEPYYDSKTNFVDPRWDKTYSLKIPVYWTTGIYAAELNVQDKNKTYTLFVVKNPKNSGAIVMALPMTTYQAYNPWGGKSLYDVYSDERKAVNSLNPHMTRAFKVTFDRPYAEDNGMGQFLKFDYPLVRFLEKNNYDVSYISDIDLHEDAKILDGYKVFISSGHDEYWSYDMRKNLEKARDKGLNLIFSGGNTAYWQIRFEDSTGGGKDRVMVCYKHKALDPMLDKDNTLVTVRWRDPPVNLPENSLVGTLSDGRRVLPGPFTVVNSYSWVYDGTDFHDGDKVPGIMGYEVQNFVANGFEPKDITILGHSYTTSLNGKANFADTVLFTTKSGSLVFSTGSIQWNWGLDGWLYYDPKNKCGANTCEDKRLEKMMNNIIENMISRHTSTGTK